MLETIEILNVNELNKFKNDFIQDNISDKQKTFIFNNLICSIFYENKFISELYYFHELSKEDQNKIDSVIDFSESHYSIYDKCINLRCSLNGSSVYNYEYYEKWLNNAIQDLFNIYEYFMNYKHKTVNDGTIQDFIDLLSKINKKREIKKIINKIIKVYRSIDKDLIYHKTYIYFDNDYLYILNNRAFIRYKHELNIKVNLRYEVSFCEIKFIFSVLESKEYDLDSLIRLLELYEVKENITYNLLDKYVNYFSDIPIIKDFNNNIIYPYELINLNDKITLFVESNKKEYFI